MFTENVNLQYIHENTICMKYNCIHMKTLTKKAGFVLHNILNMEILCESVSKGETLIVICVKIIISSFESFFTKICQVSKCLSIFFSLKVRQVWKFCRELNKEHFRTRLEEIIYTADFIKTFLSIYHIILSFNNPWREKELLKMLSKKVTSIFYFSHHVFCLHNESITTTVIKTTFSLSSGIVFHLDKYNFVSW